MASIRVTPLSLAIGAEVEGVALAERPLSDEEVATITEALVKHQVIFFRGNQEVTPEQQQAFAARFGELLVHPFYPNSQGLPGITVLDADGEYPPDTDNWHTDGTWMEAPPLGTILLARQLPPPCGGGDTLWSSCTAAYDALSPPMQELLLKLHAEHDYGKSFPAPMQWRNGGDPVARWEAGRKRYPAVVHPVIRTHPVSGRKAIFVSDGVTTRILDLSEGESKMLLAFLAAHVVQPQFTVRWRWQVGDLAFLDNRCTQHFAVKDYLPHRRVMHRATVLGDKPF